MRTIVLASSNEHKIKEFKQMFPNDNILSLGMANKKGNSKTAKIPN